MADKKISEFVETLTPDLTSYIPVVDLGTNQKVSILTLFDKASAYLSAGDWNDVSTLVKSESGNWGIDSAVRALTSNYEAVSNFVLTNGSDWQSTHVKVTNDSPTWQDTSTVVAANSASWAIDSSTDSGVRALTSKYEDVSTTVAANSASWAIDSSIDSEVRALTSNWESTYTSVCATSGSYATTNFVESNFLNLTGGTVNGSISSNQYFFDSNGSSSQWNSVYSYVSNASSAFVLSGDPRLTNSRTPTQHKSSHAIGGIDYLSPSDIGAVSTTELVQVSGNWQSSYTYLTANSATFATTNYADSKYFPLTGGTVFGSVSSTGQVSISGGLETYSELNGTPTLIVDLNNVGINTDSPSEALTVIGNISASGDVFANVVQLSNVRFTGRTIMSNSATGTNLYLQISVSGQNKYLMLYDL